MYILYRKRNMCIKLLLYVMINNKHPSIRLMIAYKLFIFITHICEQSSYGLYPKHKVETERVGIHRFSSPCFANV